MSKAVDRLFKTVMGKYGDPDFEPPQALMDRPLETVYPALQPTEVEPLPQGAMMNVPVVTDMNQLAGLSQMMGGMMGQGGMPGLMPPPQGPVAPQPAAQPQGQPQAQPRGRVEPEL